MAGERWVGIGLLGLLAGCGGTPMESAQRMVQPLATPAPGGGPTSYPEGTVFATGNVDVDIGPGGTFTPGHVYLRPGTTTTLHNRDTVPHAFKGVGAATDAYGAIPPGGTLVKHWQHPGTWTFTDPLTPNGPVLLVTDVPER